MGGLQAYRIWIENKSGLEESLKDQTTQSAD